MMKTHLKTYGIPFALISIVVVLLLPTLSFSLTYVNDFVFYHDFDYYNAFYPSLALIWSSSFFPLAESVLHFLTYIFSFIEIEVENLRALNLSIHILNTLLLYKFLKNWKPTPEENQISLENSLVSIGSFILHPLSIALIVWLPGFKMLLGCSFLLLAFLLSLQKLSSLNKTLIAICFLAASLCHPYLLLAPFCLFLFHRPNLKTFQVVKSFWLSFFTIPLVAIFLSYLQANDFFVVDLVFLNNSVFDAFQLNDYPSHIWNILHAARDLISFNNYEIFYMSSSLNEFLAKILSFSSLMALFFLFLIFRNWKSLGVRRGCSIAFFFVTSYLFLKPVFFRIDTLHSFSGIYSTSEYAPTLFLYPALMGLCLIFRDGVIWNDFKRIIRIKDGAYIFVIFFLLFPFHLSQSSKTEAIFNQAATNDPDNLLAKSTLTFLASDQDDPDNNTSFKYTNPEEPSHKTLLDTMLAYANGDFAKGFDLLSHSRNHRYFNIPLLDFLIYEALGKNDLETLAIGNIRKALAPYNNFKHTLPEKLKSLEYEKYHEPIRNYFNAAMDLYHKEEYQRATLLFLTIKALDQNIISTEGIDEEIRNQIDPKELVAWIIKTNLKNTETKKDDDVKK